MSSIAVGYLNSLARHTVTRFRALPLGALWGQEVALPFGSALWNLMYVFVHYKRQVFLTNHTKDDVFISEV